MQLPLFPEEPAKRECCAAAWLLDHANEARFAAEQMALEALQRADEAEWRLDQLLGLDKLALCVRYPSGLLDHSTLIYLLHERDKERGIA